MAKRYGRALFYCFDDPRIPAWTNALEGLFGGRKHHLRETLGTASTTNGVAQNLGSAYFESTMYVRTHTREAMLDDLGRLDLDDVRRAQRRLEEHERPARLRRSRRRYPVRHLRSLLDLWRAQTQAGS